MEGEFIKEDIGGETTRRIRVRRQGRHPAAVTHSNFKRLAGGVVGKAIVAFRLLKRGGKGSEVYLEPLVHGLTGLPFAARKDDPADLAALKFGPDNVLGDLKRGGVGLARLAREHPDLEPALIVYPAALVRIQNGGHVYASPR